MATYRHTFTVQSKFPFPIDMLRYDRCIPESSEDARAIAESIEHQGGNEVKVVTLIADKETKAWAPTAGRWQSFGWELVPSVEARIGKRP